VVLVHGGDAVVERLARRAELDRLALHFIGAGVVLVETGDDLDQGGLAGVPDDGTDWSTGTKTSRGSSVTVTCPVCGTSRPDKELRAYAREQGFGHYLYAVMEICNGHRSYREPTLPRSTPPTRPLPSSTSSRSTPRAPPPYRTRNWSSRSTAHFDP